MSTTAEKKEIKPTDEQLRSSNPENSVWVSANAGSGKTHVLIDRVVRLLLQGADPQSILCLTYTKAAATEMATRLFDRLSGFVQLGDADLKFVLALLGEENANLERARRLFALAIEVPGGLKIQTIHAFCEKLLQLFPVEAGIAPGFRVMNEDERLQMLREAYQAILVEQAQSGTELELMEEGAVSGREAFETLAKAFLSGNSPHAASLKPEFTLDALEVALRHELGVDAHVERDDLLQMMGSVDLERYAAVARRFSGIKKFYDYDIAALLHQLVHSPDQVAMREALHELAFTKAGTPRSASRLFSKDTLKSHADDCEWLCAAYLRFVEQSVALSLIEKILATRKLVEMMRQVQQRFTMQKQRRGLYDFDDLIQRSRQLLTQASAAQWVLKKMDQGLAHILVDEAQDTSPELWEIVGALAEEFFAGVGATPGLRTIFGVGDIKQSIYSFQGADTQAFLGARDVFRARVEGANKKFVNENLTVSYRTVQQVLDVVDGVFNEKGEAVKGLGPGQISAHSSTRLKESGFVQVWPLMPPDPEAKRDPWYVPVDREKQDSSRLRLARFIADRIAGWIGKRTLGSSDKVVDAGDILILFQSRSALFRMLIAELRKRGVPVAGADRLKLAESLAVHDVVALAQVMLQPEDDLALAAVLKSPLVPVPLSEEELFALAFGRKLESLWQHMTGAGGADAAALLEYKGWGQSLSPYDFFARIVTLSRKNIVERLGPEALDATDMFLDLALGFERDHGHSLQDFLLWFLEQSSDQKRELDKAEGRVRLMTVHGAKGLEAPIVILADAADVPSGGRSSKLMSVHFNGMQLPLLNVHSPVKPDILDVHKTRSKDKLKEERKRLLYVAMTRARDELYVCGTVEMKDHGTLKSTRDESWYALIDEALQKQDKVEFEMLDIGHPNGDAGHFGVMAKAVDGMKHRLAADMELPHWAAQKVKVPTAHSRSTVTGLAKGDEVQFDRAAAKRGRAIHRLLEVLGQVAPEQLKIMAGTLEIEEELVSRLLDLVEGDARAFFSSEAKAEVSIAGDVPGIGPVEGQIDRLLISGKTIWLLDFKSDRRPPLVVPEAYVNQLALYTALLTEAYPGHGIKAAILWTQTGVMQWLENTALSQSLENLRGKVA